ncbi:hypothetical protein AAG570_010658 [Ranatra chinensis]|uniref:Leucine-rich melanocyte differentiation-associated protein-like n=1 Tax=Ranatra chinensis TaxID=642074 RepID=A0ABD0YN63_9HEMI
MFLENFKCLTSLILDHNMIDANVVFPKMQTVTLLWLNYNDIRNLDPFIRLLHSSFPSLKQLSLMGNEIVPPCREDTFYYYIQYRMYVLSWFRNLEHLDDRSVCQYELEEAQRIYKRPLLDRIQSTSLPKMFQTSLNVLKQLISWDTTTSNETERYHSSVV